jgi:selenocysteine-specific elongation factor
VAAGLLVLDADPPPLDRRGAAAARASALATASGTVDALAEVSRRGAMTRAQLRLLGVADLPQSGVRQIGDWLVADETWQGWVDAVEPVLARWAACSPLDPAMPLAAAAHELGVPDAELMTAVAEAAHIPLANGRLRAREASHSLGPAEAGVRTLEDRLRETPFAAPEADELAALGLGRRELAAAQRLARLIRVGDVVLLPSAPDEALRRLRALPQPFTLSDARRALSTTRRVAVPLMEYLDERKYTERVDATLRRVLD